METRIDSNRKSTATINMSIMIASPIINAKGDAVWQIVHVNNDGFSIVLNGYDPQDLMKQIVEQIELFKEQWKDKIISLRNWQDDVTMTTCKMENELS